jgi:hypothetical protein
MAKEPVQMQDAAGDLVGATCEHHPAGSRSQPY